MAETARFIQEPERRVPVFGEYEMLLPCTVRNLLVAGRCASMDHEGQSAARVSGSCFVMGEAAGTAAHLALAQRRDPAGIPVADLQRVLQSDGAYLGQDRV